MKVLKWVTIPCVLGALVCASPAQAAFVAVGVYDEQVLQANSVDFDAAYSAANSTGVGANPALVFGHVPFAPAVLAAFNAGRGGVVQFDDPTELVGGGGHSFFDASFAGGTKTLRATNAGHLRTDFVNSGRTAISGSTDDSYLAKSDVGSDSTNGGNYEFTLTETGFEPGEHVRAIAGTILGRNGSSPVANWLMQVTLDNGDVIAALRGINSTNGNATDDTFFGAYAPAGRYITGVSWTNPNGVFSALDDFAFITSTGDVIIPEPSSMLIALGMTMLVTCGTRRRS